MGFKGSKVQILSSRPAHKRELPLRELTKVGSLFSFRDPAMPDTKRESSTGRIPFLGFAEALALRLACELTDGRSQSFGLLQLRLSGDVPDVHVAAGIDDAAILPAEALQQRVIIVAHRFEVAFRVPDYAFEVGVWQGIVTDKIYYGADSQIAQDNGSVSVTKVPRRRTTGRRRTSTGR